MSWTLPFDEKDITCRHGVVDELHPRGHRGTDFGKGHAKANAPIKAICDGKVTKSEWHDNLGNVVVVKLPTGKFWYSCHLAEPGLALGTVVKAGDVIGKVGNTGRYSFGAHLHTGIADHNDGVYSGTVHDIVKYVKEQNAAQAKPAKAEAVAAAPAESVSKDTAKSAEKWFTVKAGDTYESFAKRCSVSVDSIKKLNNSKELVVGEKVRIK